MGWIGNAPSQGLFNGGQIVDGTVDTVDLKDKAVTSAKLGDTAIADKLGYTPANAANLTPTQISDKDNTSTGYLDLPSGTTAQRPASPAAGYTRYNTQTGTVEFYNGSSWISTNLIPVINSLSGNLYAGATTNLTLSISNGTDIVSVRFSKAGVTLADVSNIAVVTGNATVSVPSSVYSSVSASDVVAVTVFNVDGTPASNYINKTVLSLPSGGSITSYNGYRIHTFTSSGNLVVPSGVSLLADLLMVAGGGGGGGDIGGGGGGGGMLTPTSQALSAGTYTISIGAGGASVSGGYSSTQQGSNTTFTGQTSVIGGGGGGTEATGDSGAGSGGSGGGKGPRSAYLGSGTAGQGNNGGLSAGPINGHGAGGGGGANSIGTDGNGNIAGDGGAGRQSNIDGNNYYYAGGGGGAVYGAGGTKVGNGGIGGGGGGGNESGLTSIGGASARNSGGGGNSQNGFNGGANTGGGGGGGSNDDVGGSGGSGIAIIRYQLT